MRAEGRNRIVALCVIAVVAALTFAIRNLIVLKRLPAKPPVCEQTGRKTIL